MRILIVEDEPAAATRLGGLIKDERSGVESVRTEATAHGAANFLLKEDVDLIFLDVQLADGLCFDIFEAVEPKCPVIFCTAYDDYAIQAFKANGIEYLLKPIRAEDIARAFTRYDNLAAQFKGDSKPLTDIDYDAGYKKRFLIRAGDRLLGVNVADIAFLQSLDRNVIAMTRSGKDYYIDGTLTAHESKLDPDIFFRVNRQRIIAFDAIQDIRIEDGKYQLKIEAEPSPVRVSREKMASFRKWLDR